MKRNIDVLKDIQRKIYKFRVATEEMNITLSDENIELIDMITGSENEIDDIIVIISDIDRLLSTLTEDIRNAMCNAGFDCDDYAVWNEYISDNPYELEGRLESVEEALAMLDFFILESLKGYKMITQLAYDPETAKFPMDCGTDDA